MTMDDSDLRKPTNFVTGPLSRRRSWCCSFAVPPASPDVLSISSHNNHIPPKTSHHRPKPVPCSPQTSKSPLNIVNRIDPRRILSPGRVSPIDSDLTINSMQDTETTHQDDLVTDSTPKLRSESFRAPKIEVTTVSGSGYDARLSLKGRNGGVLVLELRSEVLATNSDVFAGLIVVEKNKFSSSSSLGLKNNTCRIEVTDVENLGVFRETVELMFEESNGIIKKFMKMGVYRAIDVLEVGTKCSSFFPILRW